jgi:hypothetical protein
MDAQTRAERLEHLQQNTEALFVFRLMSMDQIAPWLGSGVGLRLLIFVSVVVAALVVAKIFFR